MANLIEAFDDVERKPLSIDDGTVGGRDYLNDVGAMQVGFGSKVLRVDESGIWLGAKKFADAPFSVNMLGDVIASSITLTQYNKSFVSTIAWTATDADTASWAAGTITLVDGTVYSIVLGNTGNIAATTYIYLDTAISTTVLQTTTTPANAIGANKIPLAIVEAGAAGTTVAIAILNSKGTILDGSKIVTNSLDADRIKASTIDVAVDVGTGAASSYVRLDGANNRIVINDGTTNRIVIGNV